VALTRRGKVIVGGISAVVAAGAAVGILALTGTGDRVLRNIPIVGDELAGGPEAPPVCPLTGVRRDVPERPALAIKVENLPDARPQAGLDGADIVYEEPVEGGITRFIVVYQCDDADRVGPVRSARHTDVGVLLQYGTRTLFGYAGGAGLVKEAIADAGFVSLSYNEPPAVEAYERDQTREAPHNLYTTTQALYEVGGQGPPPPAQFTYRKRPPAKGKQVESVNLDFSSSADVFWRFDGGSGRWLRSHGDEPHLLEGDVQVQADNVVVQLVELRDTGIRDAAGNPSPEAITVGSGKAFVFRDGRMVEGTWERPDEGDTTTFLDQKGRRIALKPGITWVELFPKDKSVETE
jgi:hypothetical protein